MTVIGSDRRSLLFSFVLVSGMDLPQSFDPSLFFCGVFMLIYHFLIERLKLLKDSDEPE